MGEHWGHGLNTIVTKLASFVLKKATIFKGRRVVMDQNSGVEIPYHHPILAPAVTVLIERSRHGMLEL